jgi:hypothetical protein
MYVRCGALLDVLKRSEAAVGQRFAPLLALRAPRPAQCKGVLWFAAASALLCAAQLQRLTGRMSMRIVDVCCGCCCAHATASLTLPMCFLRYTGCCIPQTARRTLQLICCSCQTCWCVLRLLLSVALTAYCCCRPFRPPLLWCCATGRVRPGRHADHCAGLVSAPSFLTACCCCRPHRRCLLPTTSRRCTGLQDMRITKAYS